MQWAFHLQAGGIAFPYFQMAFQESSSRVERTVSRVDFFYRDSSLKTFYRTEFLKIQKIT